MAFSGKIHLFCHVVDNFGDIGVCWRLARQLAGEHQARVTLWVDNLASFHKICSAIDTRRDVQHQQGVEIRRWHDALCIGGPQEVADVVIEAFGCPLPSAYLAAMAVRQPKPVWINLEYLSAEPWVEGCHAMPSHHPSLPLIKYFFFPGFTSGTGGLLMESDLLARRDAFQKDPLTASAFLRGIGAAPPEGACKISLFCYPHAPVASLLAALQSDACASICFVPHGVAADAVSAFLQQPANVGARVTRGRLTLQVLPFLDQPDYDRLLWSCDLNFVRGEDSLVRAQWAGRPFTWHIYPQEERAHEVKLNALLDRYTASMAPDLARIVSAAWHAWNEGVDMGPAWQQFRARLPQMQEKMPEWLWGLQGNGDLASNLLRFIQKIC